MPKKPGFPRKMFVVMEQDGSDTYYLAHDQVDGIQNGATVAVYELKEFKKVAVTTTLVDGSKK